jgi:hypothetical protein
MSLLPRTTLHSDSEQELPSSYWQKHGNFHPFELWKLLKMFNGFSPIFALYNHITFSLTQTGVTVPLKWSCL